MFRFSVCTPNEIGCRKDLVGRINRIQPLSLTRTLTGNENLFELWRFESVRESFMKVCDLEGHESVIELMRDSSYRV